MRILILLVVFLIQISAYAWEPPVLSTPNDGAYVEAGVTLDWNSVVGSDGYVLELDTTNNFNSPQLFQKEEAYINSSNYNDDTREYVDGLLFGQQYFWRVRAFSGVDSSDWVMRGFNTYEFVSFTSPSNDAFVETGVTFDWDAFTGVSFYDFQVDTTSDFNSPVLIEVSNAYISSVGYNEDTRTYVSDLYFGQQYFWRIRARTAQDTSEWNTRTFNTTTQIELFSPIDGAMVEASATLDWDAHNGIDFYEYQMDTTESFNSAELIQGLNAYINSSNYNEDTKFFANNLFMEHEYHWRVRMINAVDTSEWTEAFFVTDTYVDLTNPSSGAFVEVGVTIDWEAFSGAEYYDYQIDTTDSFNSSVLISGSNEYISSVNYNADTEHYVSELFFGKTYHWRVRARNSNDTSEWKSSTFITKDNVVLQSPSDESIVENGVTLNWDAHSGVDFYQYQADTSNLFNSPALLEGENDYISGVNYNDDTEAYINDLYFGKTYYWRVRAGHSLDTSAYEIRSFITSNDVDLVSPSNNATNISTEGVTLNWDAHSGIDFYHLQIDSSNIFEYPIKDTLIAYISNVNYNGDTDFYLSDLAEETTYFWRIRVINAVDTSEWTQRVFSTGNNVVTVPDAPELEYPSDNEDFVLPDLTFTWSLISNVTSYEINWSLTADFVIADVAEISSNTHTVTGLLNDTTYYWRVRAKNGAIVSEWASVYSFSTGIEVPQLLSPTLGEINIDLNEVDLTWNNIDNVTYKVQLSANVDFNPAFSSTTSTNVFTASDLEHFQDYYWRVQSLYGDYTSDWSTVSQFKTRLEAPQLLLPVNDTVGIDPANVTLSWSPVDSAQSYLYQYTQSSDFSSFIEGVTNETSIELPELNENTEYFWRVMAIYDQHESFWSLPFGFSTGTSIGIGAAYANQWIIYPNPVSDFMRITNLNGERPGEIIQLYSAMGKVLGTYKVAGNDFQIDVSELPSGIYFLKVGNQNTRFIKE
jgi:hypothetical protein